MESVLITGGTGLIGSHLTKALLTKGFKVSHLTRSKGRLHLTEVKEFLWDPEKGTIEDGALDHDYIVHLAGANIGEQRWTSKRKEEIHRSRVDSAQLLVTEILKKENKPKAYISASAVGYYGAVTSKHPFTENDKPGNDFLSQVCVGWEKAAEELADAKIRTVFIRTAFVLSPVGGGLEKLSSLARKYMLSPLGSGKQIMPWVHLADLVNAYVFAITNEKMSGPFNVTADDQRTNHDFHNEICKACGTRMILPAVPKFILRVVTGQIAEILTEGSPVSNSRLKKYGFDFVYSTLPAALRDCIKE